MVQYIWARTTHSNNVFLINFNPNLNQSESQYCSFPDGNGPKETPWEFNKENRLTKPAVVPSGNTNPLQSPFFGHANRVECSQRHPAPFPPKVGVWQRISPCVKWVGWSNMVLRCYTAHGFQYVCLGEPHAHTQSTKGKWAWSFNKFCGLSSVLGLCWLVWWRTPPFSSWQNDVGLATLQTTNLPTPSTLERKIFKAIITKNNDIIIGVLFQPILVES